MPDLDTHITNLLDQSGQSITKVSYSPPSPQTWISNRAFFKSGTFQSVDNQCKKCGLQFTHSLSQVDAFKSYQYELYEMWEIPIAATLMATAINPASIISASNSL